MPSLNTCTGLPSLVTACAALLAVIYMLSESFWWWSRWRRHPQSFSFYEALFQFELTIGSLPIAGAYDDEGRFGLLWNLIFSVLVVFILGLLFECAPWPFGRLLGA